MLPVAFAYADGHIIIRVFSVSLPVQALTFNKIASMQQGRIDIKYRRIACQVPTDMSVIVDANVGAGAWIRLQVKVCRNPQQTMCDAAKLYNTACHASSCLQFETTEDAASYCLICLASSSMPS